MQEPLPLAPRHLFAPDLGPDGQGAACRSRNPRLRRQRDVLGVRHVEIAGVGVENNVETGGGDKEGESEVGEGGEEVEFRVRGVKGGEWGFRSGKVGGGKGEEMWSGE